MAEQKQLPLLKRWADRVLVAVRDMKRERARRKHAAALGQRVGAADKNYEEYLSLQLDRTLGKKDAPLPERAKHFTAEIAKHINLKQTDVLGVGCRNVNELLRFRELGARTAKGIDLYSESPDILVMDMHNMTFADASFDLVYSSHSLEHSLEPKRAVAEFVRVVRPGGCVAIEVPVRYKTQGSDIHDFGSREGLLELFTPVKPEVLWGERESSGATGNDAGTTVERLLVRIPQRAVKA